ncbi:sialin-like [Onthophagus taurus]|uniref:sialin-like n=1 Tax=Onthophagus taurus TaxID=166361 RepID=UPI000C20945E|nr:sialin-like [Onthophagus taurus]
MVKCCPLRLTVVILTSLGFAILYGIRVNIAMTIVRMVKRTNGNNSNISKIIEGPCGNRTVNKKDLNEGEYEWSNELQGVILSSYYWGYMVVMIPGARLSELSSVKWVWFGAVVINMIGSLITPICADFHYGALLAVRIMQGFAGGILITAMPLILGRWVPVHERNTMSGITFSGAMVGLVASTVTTGLIEIHLGWKAVFYVMGGACVPYLIAWVVFLADFPEKSNLINQEELEMILNSLGDTKGGYKKKIVIYWKRIFKSIPFWGLVITHGCANWVGYFLATDLAIYMDKVFQVDMDYITIYIASGGTASWIFSIALGRTLDYLRKYKNYTQTTSKRIATIVSYGPMSTFFCIMAFVGCHTTLGIVLCILIYMAFGGTYCGWLSNHVDIGPKIAATLMALTNTVGTVSGIVVPIFVGAIIGDGLDINSWFIIYLVTAGFAILVLLFFLLMCSGENQNYYDEVEVTSN